MSNASPRNLDPKFKDAEVPDDAVNGNDNSPTTGSDSGPEVPMITHRVRFIDDNGVQQTRDFGPMPVAEYDAWLVKYEAGEVK